MISTDPVLRITDHVIMVIINALYNADVLMKALKHTLALVVTDLKPCFA